MTTSPSSVADQAADTILALEPKALRAYRNALKRSHRVRVACRVLNRNEDPIGEITQILSGQVDTDVSQSPTKRLTLVALTPRRSMAFDPDSPDEASLFARRFLAVRRGIYVDELQRWIEPYVFWGPITAADYEDEQITLTAEGKESLLLDPHRAPTSMSWRKGEKAISVMRDILQAFGEQRIHLPELDHKLPQHASLTTHEAPWPMLQHLAASMNRHLYYTNSGIAKLRMHPENPSYVFHDGQGGTLLTKPKVGYARSFFNAVEVLGPPVHTKGQTHTPTPPPDGPASPGLHFSGTPTVVQTAIANALAALGLPRDPWTVAFEITSRYESNWTNPTSGSSVCQDCRGMMQMGIQQYASAHNARPNLVDPDYADPEQAMITAALYVNSQLSGFGGYHGVGNLLKTDRGVARVYRSWMADQTQTADQLAPLYYQGGGY